MGQPEEPVRYRYALLLSIAATIRAPYGADFMERRTWKASLSDHPVLARREERVQDGIGSVEADHLIDERYERR
jgi:hypothetical protein